MGGISYPNCALCRFKFCASCFQGAQEAACPLTAFRDVIKDALREYSSESVRAVHTAAAEVEKEGYCVWPRLREVAEFARRLGVRKLGVAFCEGLSREAEEVVKYFMSLGFEVYSVICKCGGVDKADAGLGEEVKLRPGSKEAMCNPVAQAMLLNAVGTELNVIIGLCVGHDSLFIKYSKALVTYLIAKDRVTGHNPAAAIYAKNYFSSRLGST